MLGVEATSPYGWIVFEGASSRAWTHAPRIRNGSHAALGICMRLYHAMKLMGCHTLHKRGDTDEHLISIYLMLTTAQSATARWA